VDSALFTWLVDTLRAYPELAVFFALAVGFAVGPWKLGGFTLGNVTATLLAGVLIGQLGITVGGPIKSAFFLLFLFAVGYGVGPQFFRGLGKEGPRQIVFSLVVLVLCLVVPVLCAVAAGLNVLPISIAGILFFTVLQNGPFALLFAGSAWLFRKSGRSEPGPGIGFEARRAA